VADAGKVPGYQARLPENHLFSSIQPKAGSIQSQPVCGQFVINSAYPAGISSVREAPCMMKHETQFTCDFFQE